MNTLTIKTSWKQPWKRKSLRVLSYLLGIAGVLLPLAILLYTLISVLTGKGNPYADSGMKVSDTVIMDTLIMVGTCFVCLWPQTLVKYLFPITYAWKDEAGVLSMSRNGKTVFQAGRADITDVQFITHVVRTSGGMEVNRGSSFGDTLQIDYTVLRRSGRKSPRQFKMSLAWVEDIDKVRLGQFITDFRAPDGSSLQ